jgi:hypothetical protein
MGGEPGCLMTTHSTWSWVEAAAQLLEANEREAVLGDLLETGETAWYALFDVLGLAIRRHAGLWKSWRPWLAAFGLALPSTLLLMGFSVSISQAYQHLVGPTILRVTGLKVGPGLFLLLCNVFLLVAWAWTGGFVVGSISRRTVWVSAALSCVPCLVCVARFRVECLSRLCLLLFIPPAVWGARQGLRITRIKLGAALVLAVAVTALTVPFWSAHGPWLPNWALSWPAWYLVFMARRPISDRLTG